ncbi:peptidase inhibitor family I36 protein [Streptomyces tremellae]|uniref:Peptidase inhibitor family I36 protein n=1 Tax=Streptomyces tremellae TaxID=1124239 RepID=A0ABP7EG59_9ACTN
MRRTKRTTALALLAAALSCAAGGTAPAGAAPAPRGDCAPGELCLWPEGGYGGPRSRYELTGLVVQDCVRLRGAGSALSLANRLGRPVTVYQSEECAETGEFETYPGHGTWVPRSPYRVRAFKVWER